MKDESQGGVNNDVIWGRNTVMEALRSDSPPERILVLAGERQGSIIKILSMASDAGIPIVEAGRRKLDEISGGSAHQGVAAFIPARQYCDISDILKTAAASDRPPFVIVLDGIEDSRNLGGIIRTAECMGAHGVVIPKRRSAGLNAAAAKAASGALEYIQVARVSNLSNAIEELKEAGLWTVAADAGGDSVFKADLSGPLALVIGGEGEGVSRLLKQRCDMVVSIPMLGRISSLNASVAAGMLMYEKMRRDMS
ncbi:MAG: 23S rRNA (guanosine(2251)-2'-O)-methyltransferase RlmB [Christensenellales bacterium]|jgi:23S rRNA (guanosine2251-2'-O)-methyltransferase